MNVSKVQPKPKRRGAKGHAAGLEEGDRPGARGPGDPDLRREPRSDGSLKKFKPTSPGRRFMSVSTFEEVTKTEPEKSLLPRRSRRPAAGTSTAASRRATRAAATSAATAIIDFKRRKDGVPAKVAAIEYDPNRSARIALLHYADGAKAYILAPARLRSARRSSPAPAPTSSPGNALPLENIPTGTLVHNVELKPGRAARWPAAPARASSSSPRTTATACCASPPGEMRRVPLTCRATVGQVGNVDHENITGGKAGRSRWLRQAPDRARLGDEPRRPPARRRRGQVEGRPAPGHAVGRADARQAHARASTRNPTS